MKTEPGELRPLREGDIPGGQRLQKIAGWNQTQADWELFLRLRPEGCFVVAEGSAILGTVASVSYDDAVAWVSLLLVDPDWRGQGIGRRLLQAALASLPESMTVKLDATEAGEPLYRSLGFTVEEDWYRAVRPAAFAPPPRTTTTPTTTLAAVLTLAELASQKNLLEQVIESDAKWNGFSRGALLRTWSAARPERTYALPTAAGPAGYLFTRPGDLWEHWGPLGARTLTDALRLLDAAADDSVGTAVVLDAREHGPAFHAALTMRGFEIQRRLRRMSRGPARPIPPGNLIWAVAGPEWG